MPRTLTLSCQGPEDQRCGGGGSRSGAGHQGSGRKVLWDDSMWAAGTLQLRLCFSLTRSKLTFGTEAQASFWEF